MGNFMILGMEGLKTQQVDMKKCQTALINFVYSKYFNKPRTRDMHGIGISFPFLSLDLFY